MESWLLSPMSIYPDISVCGQGNMPRKHRVQRHWRSAGPRRRPGSKQDAATTSEGTNCVTVMRPNLVGMRRKFTDNSSVSLYQAVWRPASTAPSAPYGSTDLLSSYGSNNRDANSRLPGHSNSDDQRITSGNYTDRSATQRSSDLERNTPLRSHPISRKSLSFNGKGVSVDGERERSGGVHNNRGDQDVLPAPTATSYSKQSGGGGGSKANNNNSLRNNFLSGRDQDDLVAMGTNWNPSTNTQPLYRNTSRGMSSSYMGNGSLTCSSNGTTLPAYMGTGTGTGQARRGVKNNVTALNSTPKHRESDPRYCDPFVGAPPSFQQRIAELASLEADTLRYERARKIRGQKKKVDT